MAVEPLYSASLSELLTKVRISTAEDAQSVAAIHQAVTDVRLGFYRQLGRERAQAVAELAVEENPTSENGVLRASAISAEVIWTTFLLMTRLPVLFIDNSGSTLDKFNDEPLTRDATALQDTINDLKSQLTDLMAELADDDSNVKSSAQVALNGPSTTYLNSEYRIGNPIAASGLIIPAGVS